MHLIENSELEEIQIIMALRGKKYGGILRYWYETDYHMGGVIDKKGSYNDSTFLLVRPNSPHEHGSFVECIADHRVVVSSESYFVLGEPKYPPGGVA